MDSLESVASNLPIGLIAVLAIVFFILIFANRKLKEMGSESKDSKALNKIIDILTLAFKNKTLDSIKDPEKKKEAEKMWNSLSEEEGKKEEPKKES